MGAKVRTVRVLPPLDSLAPPFHFGCCVADPPWSFRDKGSRFAPDQKRPTPLFPGEVRIYNTMELDDICALPVQTMMRQQSHLYLWCPMALLETHPWKVFAAWGFDYKTGLIWRKLTKNGKEGFYGGHYFRGAHEVCLLGVRGGILTSEPRNVRSIFSAQGEKVGKHSSKPSRLQEIAERASPGPYLELFGRRSRPGWVVWGDQCPEVPA